MHSIIGNKIAETLEIEDKASFLLGSIAPDAVFSQEEKNRSHFFIGEVRDFSRSVDYKGFLHKYSSPEDNPYLLGYCTHLIADDIWLKGFYLSWLRNRMNEVEGLSELYHRDFRLLNGKLLKHYGYTDDLRKTFLYDSAIPDLEEVKSKEVERFVPYVLDDMEYDEETVNASLQVFTFGQIIGYIETSVEVGMLNLKPILTKSFSN